MKSPIVYELPSVSDVADALLLKIFEKVFVKLEKIR